jgi:hypothetical protein
MKRRTASRPARQALRARTRLTCRGGRTHAMPTGGDQRTQATEGRADLNCQTYEATPELFQHDLQAIRIV